MTDTTDTAGLAKRNLTLQRLCEMEGKRFSPVNRHRLILLRGLAASHLRVETAKLLDFPHP